MREVRDEFPAMVRRIRTIMQDRFSPVPSHPPDIPTQNTPQGLPKRISSLCPECRRRISAILSDENGTVVIRKRCPDHGDFEDVIYRNAEMYRKMERWSFADSKGIINPAVADTGRG